jgi:hypothetical protein
MSEGNGATPETVPIMLTAGEATRAIGCTRRTFERLWREGHISREDTDDGPRYPLEEIEQVRKTLFPEPAAGTGASDKIVEQMLGHQREMFALHTKAISEVQAALLGDNSALRVQVQAQAEAMQAALDRKSERELAEAELLMRMQNRQQGIEYLGHIAQAVVSQVRGSGVVSKLVRSLSPEQLGLLEAALTPEQITAVRTIRGEPAEQQQTTETNENG